MSSFDPNKFRIPDSDGKQIKQAPIPEKKLIGKTQNHKFLKGPIPLAWLIAAARLPGKTFVVGVVIWYRAGLCKAPIIKLPSTVLSLFGINRHTKRRALESLEKASLISVDRSPGKNPTITIIDVREVL